MEARREEIEKIAEEASNEALRLVSSEEAVEGKLLEETKEAVLKDKPIEEASLEELLSLTTQMDQKLAELKDSDILYAGAFEWKSASSAVEEYSEGLKNELSNGASIHEIVEKLPDEAKEHLREGLKQNIFIQTQVTQDSVGLIVLVYDDYKIIIDRVLDTVQVVLDVAGMVPVLGALPDGVNAGIHIARGNYEAAAFSAAAMIPIFGEVATVGKYTVKGVNAAKKVYAVTKADKEIAESLIENKVPQEKLGEMFQEAKKLENNYIDLASPKGRKHILDGEGNKRGGHRYGTGNPGKTEFPQNWSDDKIMHIISDIATDPHLKATLLPDGRKIIVGHREGLDIRVILESETKGGGIVSAYPINVPKNP